MQWTKWLVPATLTLAGVGVGGALVWAGQSEPARAPAVASVPSVQVVEVAPGTVGAVVRRTGVVEPAAEVSLPAVVGGEVVWVADELRVGQRVTAGQTLARIDATSYEADVASARAQLASAEQALTLEAGRGDVARLEQQLLYGDHEAGSAVVLREPQRATAEADLASARAALERRENDLSHTRIRAPFDGLVTAESLEPGAYVGTGSTVATVIGSEVGIVEVSVPLGVAQRLAVPGLNTDDDGSVGEVRTPDGSVARTGTVLGTTGGVDAQTRQLTLQVQVDAPFDVAQGVLLPGTFVEVTLDARPFDDAVAVPTSALDVEQTVWWVDAEDRLARSPVQVLWRDDDRVVVRGDLGTGYVVVDPGRDGLVGQQVHALRYEGAVGVNR